MKNLIITDFEKQEDGLRPLERVSVRRLLFYLEKQVRRIIQNRLPREWDRSLIDAYLSDSVQSCLVELLHDIKQRRGITDFSVSYMPDLSPKLLVAIQPKVQVEHITLEFTISRFRETFEDSSRHSLAIKLEDMV